jgi:hypothetical protein
VRNAIYANVVLFLCVGFWITCASPYFGTYVSPAGWTRKETPCVLIYTLCNNATDNFTTFNGKRINLFEGGHLFSSSLFSPTPKSDLEILADAQALYTGTFKADPDYWKALCFEDDKRNQVRTSCPYPLGPLRLPIVCNRTLLINEEDGQQRVQRSEGVKPWNLTRWQPSSLEEKEELKLFNHNTTVELFREMGITRINIIGDSMSR